eukprot:4513279-Prorocentrum_lima.AAC.1
MSSTASRTLCGNTSPSNMMVAALSGAGIVPGVWVLPRLTWKRFCFTLGFASTSLMAFGGRSYIS